MLLLGLSAGAVGWTVWQLRVDAIRAAIADSGNIAAVLADQLSRSIESIDTVLLDLATQTKGLDIESAEGLRAAYAKPAFYRSLIKLRDRLPQVFNIVIADASGQIVVSTAAWPVPNLNVADRDYFNDSRTRTDDGPSTSIPIDNRINGTRTVVFARRLEDAGGRFLGIVYAGVNSKYFEDIYESTQSVHSLVFSLVRRDGTILFRHPGAGDFVGMKLSQESLWVASIQKGFDGYRIIGRSDGKVRYVSVRPVAGTSLFVNTSVAESIALAGWARRSATIGLGSTALLLCSVFLLFAFMRQMRRLSESEASLTQKSQQLDVALNNMPQGLAMFDNEQRLVVCNRRYSEMYDLPPEHMRPGTSLRAILDARIARGCSPDQADYAAGALRRVSLNQSYFTINELRDGRVISISHQLTSNGGWVAIHQDITAQKRVEAELAQMARYDPLTGLANRAVFLQEVSAALRRTRLNGERLSVLMLDLDQFKVVNDSLGHATGDALLAAVAARFRAIMPNVDRVARFGGDEFALLHTIEDGGPDGDVHTESVAVLAQRILETVTRPYDIGGRKIVIGMSIGLTLAPDDGDDADALIRNADLALYKAKSEGRNRYRFFEAAMEAEGRERRELEIDMRKALACEEFELHYQTIVDVERGECRGAEALVRWRHPQRGLIPPDAFISLAEESGLIIPLGEWILRRACADAAKWPAGFKVAINLSPAQFKQSNLLDVLRAALEDSGLAPERLELEITETVLIENNEENLAVLRQLKSLGAEIVLDDFGIGYSSMRYLQIFPIDKIKIDKSFIQSMPSHADSVAIVCAIAGLARSLDIETTAEGVETLEQLTLLRGAGCQLAQGYLFSRPLPVVQLSFEHAEFARETARVA